MVEAQVAELEGLLLEEEGAILIGVFPTAWWVAQRVARHVGAFSAGIQWFTGGASSSYHRTITS